MAEPPKPTDEQKADPTFKEKDLKKIIVEPYLSKICDILYPLIEKTLNLISRKCKQIVDSPVCNLVSSTLNMIGTYLNKEVIQLDKKDLCPNPDKAMFTYIAFCLVWSLGANLHDSSRDTFSQFVKREIKEFFPEFPDGDVYEYGLKVTADGDHCLQPFSEQIEKFHYNPKESFFEILVPTNDTVKYKYLLK